ncbi:hypothetical protein FOZ62_013687 [Perkinsus olseni]|uniref:Uncharacterized protein n=1 Tax=Perkinsus olseni TaxID=32597 RepID=A0A7J6TG65_PEROL|nr:hypothetical protein FOZ62_013687 [Perkinsus olseni]
MPTPAATALDLDDSHADPEMTTPSHRRLPDEEDEKGHPVSSRHLHRQQQQQQQQYANQQQSSLAPSTMTTDVWQRGSQGAVGNGKGRKSTETIPFVRHPAPFDPHQFVAERVMLQPRESLHAIAEGTQESLPPLPLARMKQGTGSGWPGVAHISHAYSTHHHPTVHSSSTLGSGRSSYSYGHASNPMGATSGSAVFKNSNKRGGKGVGKNGNGVSQCANFATRSFPSACEGGGIPDNNFFYQPSCPMDPHL